jgi:hypothetical protein
MGELFKDGGLLGLATRFWQPQLRRGAAFFGLWNFLLFCQNRGIMVRREGVLLHETEAF